MPNFDSRFLAIFRPPAHLNPPFTGDGALPAVSGLCCCPAIPGAVRCNHDPPPTPEEALNCVDSTVFAEVELTHYWTLQPPLAAYLDIHRSIDLCSWCSASLNEEYAGNSLLRAFLTCADGTHVYWRSNCDGPIPTVVLHVMQVVALSL